MSRRDYDLDLELDEQAADPFDLLRPRWKRRRPSTTTGWVFTLLMAAGLSMVGSALEAHLRRALPPERARSTAQRRTTPASHRAAPSRGSQGGRPQRVGRPVRVHAVGRLPDDLLR
jgi:hypothetical protein